MVRTCSRQVNDKMGKLKFQVENYEEIEKRGRKMEKMK
jgi:hypothetical protein